MVDWTGRLSHNVHNLPFFCPEARVLCSESGNIITQWILNRHASVGQVSIIMCRIIMLKEDEHSLEKSLFAYFYVLLQIQHS